MTLIEALTRKRIRESSKLSRLFIINEVNCESFPLHSLSFKLLLLIQIDWRNVDGNFVEEKRTFVILSSLKVLLRVGK